MAVNDKILNMTMLCDFYELTMGNGYFEQGKKDQITYFDIFFRKVPEDGGFAIMAGLEQAIDYINHLHLTKKTLPISAAGVFSPRAFWSTWQTSNSPAMYGPFRKAPPSSPANPL